MHSFVAAGSHERWRGVWWWSGCVIEWITRAFSTRSYLDAFLSNFAGTSLVVQLGFGVAKSSFLGAFKYWNILIS